MGIPCISFLWMHASRHLIGNASEYASGVAVRDDRACQILNSDPQSDPQKARSYTTSVVLGVPHGFVSR